VIHNQSITQKMHGATIKTTELLQGLGTAAAAARVTTWQTTKQMVRYCMIFMAS
jgi:hypothetical protein